MKDINNLASDKNSYNIWRYADLYNEEISPSFRLTIGEGWTKEINLSSVTSTSGLSKLWIKRDDLNPTGSHKDRSLAFQVSKYYKEGHKNLLISSSGNAAISGAAYSQLANIRFFAFISPFTNKEKIALLKRYNAEIIISTKPINLANYISRIYNIINLRPSINDTALEGYKSIAFELAEKEILPDAIFVCPTSASTLVGIGRAYEFLMKNFGVKKPQIHAVQYGDITSLAEKAGIINKEESLNTSEIHRLGVKNTMREKEALEIINNTGGKAWILSFEEINQASFILSRYGIVTSQEGEAAFAGIIKASKLCDFKEPLCLFTGHYSEWKDTELKEKKNIYKVETYREAKKLFDKMLGK